MIEGTTDRQGTEHSINSLDVSQKTLTVTGTNWTTIRAVGIAYQTNDGAWRLRFNISGLISGTVGNITLTITGVLFKNLANYQQAINSAWTLNYISLYPSTAYVINNTNTIYSVVTTLSNTLSVSGDVELEEAPTI